MHARDAKGATPLHVAGRRNRPEAIEALLAAGAEKDVVDWDGVTPLHLAAGSGHSSAVRALLKAKADAGLKDRWGNTPVHVAAQKDNEGAIREFLYAHSKLLLRNEARAGRRKGRERRPLPLHNHASPRASRT